MSEHVTIIAEAGVNHNGDLDRALEMVAAAAAAGADYVKFQAFDAATLVAAGAKTAGYQAANTGVADQAELLRDLQIDLDGFARLAAACRENDIGFMATAFETGMADALIGMGMDRIKIASGELTNGPALARFGALGLPVILSTGMATLDEVRQAVALLQRAGALDITLLHCTSLYPAPAASLNLRAMQTMAGALGLPVGYSDHSLGDHAALAAVALGATTVEKHFTLDRTLPGPDHPASLEPDELAEMISRIREIGVMLGNGDKAPSREEAETAALVRRSWHAARDLPAGTVLADGMLVLMRPESGLPGWTSPVGATLGRPVVAGQPIRRGDLADRATDSDAVDTDDGLARTATGAGL